MSEERPSPLTPADCDLRDFAFMPLDVLRLRDSDLAALETAEAFRAAVMLWCASWHQVPAGSLPTDDRVLAKLAGYGHVVSEWQRVRPGAMRGWILCGDGRWYHPVVCEKALDAWRSKLEQRWKTECARIKKHNQRHGIELPLPDFDTWLSQGRPQGQPMNVPGTDGACPEGQPPHVPKDTGGLSLKTEGGCPDLVPRETASKGQGQGQGQGQGLVNTSETSSPHPTAAKPLVGTLPGIEEPETADEGLPPCPHQQLIALYGKHLPHLRQPRGEWAGARAAAMRVRWRECAVPSDFSQGYRTVKDGLRFWDRFLGYVASTDLAKGFPRTHGKTWYPDLPWLMNRENFLKVIEGNYVE